MKKITTLLLFTFAFLTSTAQQFAFTKLNGTPIPNGTIFTSGTFSTPADKYKFHISNISNAPLQVKIVPISMTNTAGVAFQFCYSGECNDNIGANNIYPNYDNPLAPGENNGEFDYFVNNSAGLDANSVKEIVFSIYAVGFESETITFTYRYDPQLSVSSFESLDAMGINVSNTLVSNNLEFNTAKNGVVSIINMAGQKVITQNFTEGNQNISLTHLSSAIYIANFTTTDGRTSQIKIIKK